MKAMIKQTFPSLTMLLLLLFGNAAAQASDTIRQSQSFDLGWKFTVGDQPGAEQPQFDDRAWRKVDGPHDWSIEGPFAETNKTGGAGAFLPSGVGWYRKHFTLPAGEPNRRVFVEFDGVMANSDVWINGFHLGHRPYGYVSFSHELTGRVKFGDDNVLAVRCDTSAQPASRWYSGAGIYRHVRLVEKTHIYVPQWGVFVSTPEVTATQAIVRVQVDVTNQNNVAQPVFLNLGVLDPEGKIVGKAQTPEQTLSAFGSGQFSQDIVVNHPQRWDLEHPALYQCRADVCGPPLEPDAEPAPGSHPKPPAATDTGPQPWGTKSDEVSVYFGIREFHFAAETGFWLNGKNFKIKGVCLHHDGGAFGAAVPLGIWEERLKTLKALGVNAIRTAHNPPAPEFLDLCDRLGFLVMDEFFDCWTVGKNPYDYHLYFSEWSKTDERDTIRRDRNHPSVVLYSVGNEIHDTPKAELAKGILKGLVEVAHEADPTRPVTQALFRPNVSGDYTNGLADLLDVIGTNYRDNELLTAQRDVPSRKIIGTEQRHDRQTWLWLRDNPSHSGQFLWTGVDYLGESRRWPVIGAGSGLLDRTGAPKPMAYERQSWWSEKPMVFMARRTGATTNTPTDPGFAPLERRQVLFADWSPTNAAPHDENVEIYSNGQEVELFLNGKSLGVKPLNADATPRNWLVAYAPGTLKAVARNGGKIVATDELRTAGSPAKIVLAVSRDRLPFDWDAVACVRATVVDKQGVPVPVANDLVSFKISGPGVVAAVDNADNASHEPFQASGRRAFHGRCVAYLKTTAPSGKIVVTASAPGLKSGKAVIRATGAR
ncbi:MAG TPA: glycoside hydrolase family 2 TIM barrel-domain containing protein [Candidatus Acidoferrum sp.]|nr:glycoside hydrolase family 2 TIM barrel-domain containing protein [Candidatus Acidoferrum sp.]